MARFPAYPKKPHKTGQARIRIHGQDVYLGAHGSRYSRERYAQLAAQFAAGSAPSSPGSVDDLVAAWLEEVEVRYAHDRRERGHVRYCLLTGYPGGRIRENFDRAQLKVGLASVGESYQRFFFANRSGGVYHGHGRSPPWIARLEFSHSPAT